MATTDQPPLFTLADFGLDITPTTAMRRGAQVVHQCVWCGAVVVWDKGTYRNELDTCPACGRDASGEETGTSSWWQQQLPVAGIHEHDHEWTIIGAMQSCNTCRRLRPIPIRETP